jgi:CsoR family transcriptional regulator, copper-sensing transcriptional repressor
VRRDVPAPTPSGPVAATPDAEEPDVVPDGSEARWSRRFAWPVLVAALASVPAVWLTLLDEPYRSVGTVASLLTGAVLLGETVVLFAVSRDKRRWLRQHRWLVVVTVAIVVSAVLAIGPAQLLRLVRAVGALRLLRARHIVRAGRRLMGRTSLDKKWERVVTGAVVAVVAAFVAVVLADPTSRSRVLLEGLLGGPGYVWAVVVAGLLLAGAVFVLVRGRARAQE